MTAVLAPEAAIIISEKSCMILLWLILLKCIQLLNFFKENAFVVVN